MTNRRSTITPSFTRPVRTTATLRLVASSLALDCQTASEIAASVLVGPPHAPRALCLAPYECEWKHGEQLGELGRGDPEPSLTYLFAPAGQGPSAAFGGALRAALTGLSLRGPIPPMAEGPRALRREAVAQGAARSPPVLDPTGLLMEAAAS